MSQPTFSSDTSFTSASVQKQLESSQRLYTILVISTLLLGASLGMTVLRQFFANNREITDKQRFLNDVRANAIPPMKVFVGNLQAFAKTNPDFNPILAKYGLLPMGTNAPVAAKRPAAKK